MGVDLSAAVVADHCHLQVPSSPEWIEPTAELLVRRAALLGGIHPDRAVLLTMALHEALTNSVIHGNLGIPSALKEAGEDTFARVLEERCADPAWGGREVDITADFDGQATRWVLTDEGGGFDVAAVLASLDAPPEPETALRPSGRGLLMIRAFVDEMRYDDGGRRLTLIVRAPGGANKRRGDRRPVHQRVEVAPLDAAGVADHAAAFPAVARNVSQEGMAFLAGGGTPADRVLITFTTAGEPISVQAEVRHWKPLGGDLVEVGCRFSAPPAQLGGEPANAVTPPGVEQLLAELARRHAPVVERRRSPRVPYTAGIEVRPPDGTIARGFARDLSKCGIGFFTTVALPLGMIELGLPADEGRAYLRVRARVVRSTRLADGFYEVAASFVG